MGRLDRTQRLLLAALAVAAFAKPAAASSADTAPHNASSSAARMAPARATAIVRRGVSVTAAGVSDDRGGRRVVAAPDRPCDPSSAQQGERAGCVLRVIDLE